MSQYSDDYWFRYFMMEDTARQDWKSRQEWRKARGLPPLPSFEEALVASRGQEWVNAYKEAKQRLVS
jgi:hypothetical protein